jgi:hypothetical protein
LPSTPGQTFYVVCGLALLTVLLLAWLALQPQAAPLPTGPVLPGFGWPGSARCASVERSMSMKMIPSRAVTEP